MPHPGAPQALNGIQFDSVSGIAPSTVLALQDRLCSALSVCSQEVWPQEPKAEHGELSWDVKVIQEEMKVFYGVGIASRQKKKSQQPEQRRGAVLVFPL